MGSIELEKHSAIHGRKYTVKALSLGGILIFLSAIPLLQESYAQDSDLESYTDPTGFYALMYPSDWQVVEEIDSESAQLITKMIITGSEFSGSSGINIEVQNLSEFESVDDFESAFLLALSDKITIESDIPSGLNLYRVDGYPTINFVADHGSFKSLNLFSYINGTEIRLVFHGIPDEFGKFMPQVEAMVDSIKVINNTTVVPGNS
jgi:hypothetical protein